MSPEFGQSRAAGRRDLSSRSRAGSRGAPVYPSPPAPRGVREPATATHRLQTPDVGHPMRMAFFLAPRPRTARAESARDAGTIQAIKTGGSGGFGAGSVECRFSRAGRGSRRRSVRGRPGCRSAPSPPPHPCLPGGGPSAAPGRFGHPPASGQRGSSRAPRWSR